MVYCTVFYGLELLKPLFALAVEDIFFLMSYKLFSSKLWKTNVALFLKVMSETIYCFKIVSFTNLNSILDSLYIAPNFLPELETVDLLICTSKTNNRLKTISHFTF